MSECIREFDRWLKNADRDQDLVNELQDMATNDTLMEDAFYRDLEFGTGGLRGILGAGTNRMNVYVVAKASQGIANYITAGRSDNCSVAISYDSRIKSELFARTAAEIFAENGIHVYLYSTLMPTPCLSYAVRQLQCDAGVMITASHNPAKYNGYKVYGADGCQITTRAAKDITEYISKLDVFEDIQWGDFDKAEESGHIEYITEELYTRYIDCVSKQTFLYGDEVNKDLAIVYTPLNGAGLGPVTRALEENGYSNVTVVKEQERPDGNFPTCPYPNPEIKDALTLGLEYATRLDAELLLATDPDCDRVGIAVKNIDGNMKLLTGNEVGVLLLDYICMQRTKHHRMPENPVFVKTIVTTDMAEQVASKYGVETINVLTGFKFIGEQIGLLEAVGHEDSYIFGCEESYGYLSGDYVRDKDAVNGALLICEMFAYYKTRGISLVDKLNELYLEYGYYFNRLETFTFEGAEGFNKMQSIMALLRDGVREIGAFKVIQTLDYSKGINGLPKSNVLKFLLEDKCSVVVRPSGTEPKLKIYTCINAIDEPHAILKYEKLDVTNTIIGVTNDRSSIYYAYR